MQPQEIDVNDDNRTASAHEDIRLSQELSDEDESHLEPDQVEATPRRAMEQD
jgi:hypothetical protein